MNAITKLKEMLKVARSGEDKILTDSLRTIVGDLDASGNETPPTDDQVFTYLRKNLKSVKSNIEQASQRRREDKLPKLHKELEAALAIADEFIKILSNDEITRIVMEKAAEDPSLKIGGLMRYFKENYAYRYDPRVVTEEFKNQQS